jgi:hypothetical protein
VTNGEIHKDKISRHLDDDQVMGDVEEESDDVVVDDVNIEHASNPNYLWNPVFTT